MKQISVQYHNTPVGELILGSFEGKLCLADWRYRRMRTTVDKRLQKTLDANYVLENTQEIKQTILQLSEYFDGARTQFDIPLLLVGTDFQKSVWEVLITIPFGETESYLGLSRKLGDEKAIRAVASANDANAISIIVPCHRIIGTDGGLVGYAGGLPTKKKLLTLEGIFNSEQLSLLL